MITVIGGSGFIGESLCKILKKKKIKFQILDIKLNNLFKKETKYCDVRNKSDLLKFLKKTNYIINLAAIHRDDIKNKKLYYDTNVNGAKNICEVAKLFNINSIVFTSTSAVYSLAFSTKEKNENFPVKPFNDYGNSKLMAEKLFLKWKKQNLNNSLIIIRPSVIFGENNKGNMFNLINLIKKNRFIMIGGGTNYKSITYIKNFSNFLFYLIKNKISHYEIIINYADSPDMTIGQIVNCIFKFLNIKRKNFYISSNLALIIGLLFDFFNIFFKNFSISSIRIKKFIADTRLHSRYDKLGYIPKFTIKQGIKNMINNDFKNYDK